MWAPEILSPDASASGVMVMVVSTSRAPAGMVRVKTVPSAPVAWSVPPEVGIRADVPWEASRVTLTLAGWGGWSTGSDGVSPGPVGPLGEGSPPPQPMEKLARSARSGSRCQARIGSSPEVRVWKGFDYTRLTHGRFWFSHTRSRAAGKQEAARRKAGKQGKEGAGHRGWSVHAATAVTATHH